MVKPVDYDLQQSQFYAQGRELPPESVAAWMHGFARHVSDRRPLTVLDLGSGTGRFTPALADTFGGPTYVTDRDAAAGEISRVLRSGPAARVIIRSTFADRMPSLLWHRYFPRAHAIEQEMFPTVDEVVRAFTAAGLQMIGLDQVRQRFAPSLADYAARLHLRAISTFEHLSEDEIADGFAALDADAAAETAPHPVEADSDLLILGRSPRATRAVDVG